MRPVLYAVVPWTRRVYSVGPFVSTFAVLMTLASSSTRYRMACWLLVGFLCHGAVPPIRHTRARPMSRELCSKQ